MRRSRVDSAPSADSGLTAEEAHNQAMGQPLTRVVEQLTELLGATTVAAIGGVTETRAVQMWASGEREPQRPHTLRFALQLALMMSNLAGADMSKAWFHGSNPYLEDRVPMVLLRDQALDSIQLPLMSAARAFAARSRNA